MKSNELMEIETVKLLDILKQIWKGRKLIIFVCSLSLVLGVGITFFKKNQYESSTNFIIYNSNQGSSQALSGLVALTGINVGSTNSSTSISPDLYPKIIYSLPFKMKMLKAPIVLNKNTISYGDYLKGKPTPFFQKSKNFISTLPSTVWHWIKDQHENSSKEQSLSYDYGVDIEQYNLATVLEEKVILENGVAGVINLTVIDDIPEVANQMAKWVQNELQESVISYQIKGTQQLYEYVLEQYKQRQQEVFELQDRLALFKERNVNITSGLVQNEIMRLESDYGIAESVYSELAMQKEQLALQLKKDTPLFLKIDPVGVPKKIDSLSRSSIIILMFLFGLMLSILYILFFNLFRNYLREILEEGKNEVSVK